MGLPHFSASNHKTHRTYINFNIVDIMIGKEKNLEYNHLSYQKLPAARNGRILPAPIRAPHPLRITIPCIGSLFEETPPEKSGINCLLRGGMERKSPGSVETENVLRRCRKFNICPAV